MHLFTDYIDPLISWLKIHPDLAILITFLISFSESLAIIGSIVPGSVTMTAIGILAGSGIMRIDLTLIAACLGAIFGDGGSYILGYILRDKLPFLWPFKSKPHWLSYGKDFFDRHGGKSILLGRFVGPLRSIIPVIAGMMHMPKFSFMFANITSGIAWAFVYVTPGILIGAAGIRLSTEQATRLFIFVFLTLIFIWLSSRIIKWIIEHTQVLFETKLHRAWHTAMNHPRIGPLLFYITPPHERSHQRTIAILILCLFCVLGFTFLLSGILNGLNAPIYFFLQSIRTKPFDYFFIATTLFISLIPRLALLNAVIIMFIMKHKAKPLLYLLGLNLTCFIMTYLLNYLIGLSLPIDNKIHPPHHSFINVELTFATANFVFFGLLVRSKRMSSLTHFLQLTAVGFLILTGIGYLYLGEYLATACFASFDIGLGLCLAHWIFYRRKKEKSISLIIPFIFFIGFSVVYTGLHFKKRQKWYGPNTQQYVLSNHAWWNQEVPLLPMYTRNRIGQPIGFINVQYMGSIHRFELALKAQGWKKQNDSFFQKLLVQTDKKTRQVKGASYRTELYQNRKPDLVITYALSKECKPVVLRLWQSNYHLLNKSHPLWIGNIQPYSFHAVNQFIAALDAFEVNTLTPPPHHYNKMPSPSFSTSLIVREVAITG